MAHHADPSVLKATAVTIPFVREIERCLCIAGRPALEYLKAQVGAAVSSARSHEGGIADFLEQAAVNIDGQVNVRVAPPLTVEERNRYTRMMATWRRRAASIEDASGRRASDGGAALYAAEAACLPELGEALEFASTLAGELLKQNELTLPSIEFATSFDGSVSASCRPTDGQEKLASEVTLVLPEGGFDRDSLYTVPYLLSHEIICHAAQGIEGAPPRRPSGPNCAWSDGWMDRLAFEVSVDALFGERSKQEWIEEGASTIAAIAEQAHAARHQGAVGTLKAEADLAVRRQAKEGFLQLKREATLRLGDQLEAELFARSFSIIYNALQIRPSTRTTLIIGMLVRFNGSSPERSAALDAISAFIADRNTDSLHEFFTL